MKKSKESAVVSELDPVTGLSVKGRQRTALLLGISERQLDRLAGSGKLPIRSDGLFEVRATIDAFAEYVAAKASRPSKEDGVRTRQTALLDIRFQRELKELIPMKDALKAFDEVTDNFVQALTETGAQAGLGKSRAERTRIASICDLVAKQLTARFAVERKALMKGTQND